MNTEDTRCAYRELEGRLRPFVAWRVPPADVDDVVQDVFLRVQRSLAGLKDEQSFAPSADLELATIDYERGQRRL